MRVFVVLWAFVTVSSSASELRVHVEFPNEDTGTCHNAERVRIESDGAKPYEVETDLANGTIAPLFSNPIALGRERFLLLGWSSMGGGNHTFHAWLVSVKHGSVSVYSRLEFTCRRHHYGLVLQENNKQVRLGLNKPPEEGMALCEWSLDINRKHFDWDEIRKLKYIDVGMVEPKVLVLFAPKETPSNVCWIEIGSNGFKIPKNARQSVVKKQEQVW